MQAVSLVDTLTLWIADPSTDAADGDPNLFLIDRAIDMVRKWSGPEAPSVAYSIEKRIPAAAGLGGGSSDCAAALMGTAALLNQSIPSADLLEMAATLGSDVPFFLIKGTAKIEGRGDRVTELPDLSETWFVLASSGDPVSTGAVFSEIHSEEFGSGLATDVVLEHLRLGQVAFGGNDLTAAAIRACPSIEGVIQRLEKVAGAGNVQMSGSGGTVAAIFPSEHDARSALGALTDLPFAVVVRTVSRDETAASF
jgi:4-diphosphocytidyl-2-C-methyl-D-erythritol kinase